ncbi:MAG TPA: hypothetical protein VFE97_19075 [Methylomirabilota bacterium]|nr:hypothetical protein [Methylomirabilota bacterium]
MTAAYGQMQSDASEVDLEYCVGRGPDAAYYIAPQGRTALVAPDDGTFLAAFDEDIAVELQKLRRDLYFVHAAVLTYRAAVMLVAQPGGGKSTLTWALLHHGFGFLSDELAPVDLDSLEVHPYPRTLALKREPPQSYPLPGRTLTTSRSLRVQNVPGIVGSAPVRLGAVVFVHYSPEASRPTIRRITTAEAGARLYANALNPLAHAADGLDGAVRITAACPCYDLISADLSVTSALVAETLQWRR